MAFRLRIAPLARRQVDEFALYLRNYDEALAIEQIDRLNRILAADIAEAPLTWNFFPLTGPPYRAYLFRVGRRTHHWVIYTVDEDSRTVNVLHFWNASRDPDSLDL
jgi:plasmid stabilization system protein ParE